MERNVVIIDVERYNYLYDLEKSIEDSLNKNVGLKVYDTFSRYHILAIPVEDINQDILESNKRIEEEYKQKSDDWYKREEELTKQIDELKSKIYQLENKRSFLSKILFG